VIVGRPENADTKQMLAALRRPFLPNKVVLFRPDGSEAPPIAALADFTRSQTSLKGKATAYVCQNFVCRQPTTALSQMVQALRQGSFSGEKNGPR